MNQVTHDGNGNFVVRDSDGRPIGRYTNPVDVDKALNPQRVRYAAQSAPTTPAGAKALEQANIQKYSAATNDIIRQEIEGEGGPASNQAIGGVPKKQKYAAYSETDDGQMGGAKKGMSWKKKFKKMRKKYRYMKKQYKAVTNDIIRDNQLGESGSASNQAVTGGPKKYGKGSLMLPGSPRP